MFDRTLDVAAVARLAVEVLRQEYRRQQRLELVVKLAQDGAKLPAEVCCELVAHEEPIDLPRQILPRHRLLEDDPQHVDAVEPPGPAEKRFRLAVVLACVLPE